MPEVKYLSDISDDAVTQEALSQYEDACAAVVYALRVLGEARARRDRHKPAAEAAIRAFNERRAAEIRAAHSDRNADPISYAGFDFVLTPEGRHRYQTTLTFALTGSKPLPRGEAEQRAKVRAIKSDGYVPPQEGRDK